MKVDDTLKLVMVFFFGIALGIATTYYPSLYAQKAEYSDTPLILAADLNATNFAINIPLIRIGSGIR